MKKGFTLIELLAVIVILAIIALIATPTILGVVENARMSAAEASAKGYIDAVDKQKALNLLNSDEDDDINASVYEAPLNSKYKVNVKGQIPKKGWIEVTDNGTNKYSLVIGNYVVSYDGSKIDIIKGLEPTPFKGAKKIAAKSSETHKGIVYLDPTNIYSECNASNSVSTTENKTGCMKWYIFDDSGENYKMILDHNTTARIKWNDSNKNVRYEDSNLKPVLDDLVTTYGWKLKPRLISASEINNIVGGVSTWDVNNHDTWFYFEGTGVNNQTNKTYSSSNRNKYDWLYNNLHKCKSDSTDYGCSIEDNNSYEGYGSASNGNAWGYWTSTPVGGANSGNYVWRIFKYGRLYNLNADSPNFGIRPVVTVPKNQVF